jgi:selenocysteine-specific elongation factor
VGTAGHIDHGKSTLVEALTGSHPDRLKEEKAREMTIDLGFGSMTLPDGREVGIVDVPGHRDFVENMLAGAAGIDAVLLVVAADEGVMPQTSEHLAIIDLLGVHSGVIALTKADLIHDSESWHVIESEVRACVQGTVLQDAPIVRVSARTGGGLPELLAHLSRQLSAQPDRPDLGRPRLSLDRVFSMEGFGTVITGTLTDGQLSVGDEVQILPSGQRGRIRGLQNHRRKVERVWPGSRTAVNISGLAAPQLQRGQVLIHPGQYAATRRVDARLRLLPGASTGMSHNREVKVFLGTTESTAVLRLLGTDEIQPGGEGLIQLELRHALVCARGDRFILRRPSPPETLGGGDILNASPPGRHRRFDVQAITSLRARGTGEAADVLFEVIQTMGAATVREILERSRLEDIAAREALRQLLGDGRLTPIDAGKGSVAEDQILVTQPYWLALSEKSFRVCAEFHSKFPLRAGLPREEFKRHLGLAPRIFGLILERLAAEAKLMVRGSSVALPGHQVRFGAQQQTAIAALLKRFEANPFAPPSAKACAEAVGSDVFSAMKELGQLVAVSDEVVFKRSDYDAMVDAVRTALQQSPQISLAEVRDLFGTSRKYAQAFLEHLDSIGVTRRDGDVRVVAR